MFGGFGPCLILKNKKPVRVDILTWSEFKKDPANMLVAETQVDDVHVKTVFLGFPVGARQGEMLTFETKIVGGQFDQCSRLYVTWDEAEADHNALVKQLKGENLLQFKRS